ncbi:hypothetical protein MMC15_007150 [Xylographa vitiligo]|nr:hypothetical protein [Xylographa vitiligo]
MPGRQDDQYPIRSQAKQYIRTHRRSVSTGPLQTIRDVLPANDVGQPLGDEIRSTMRRTFSLHRHHSGDAPIVRMESPPPELPREIPRWSRVQALRSHPKDPGVRASTVSSVSLSSSLYDDDVFGPPVRNEIDLGSIGLLLEPNNELSMSPNEAIRSWNGHDSQMPGTAVFSNSSELAQAKLYLRQRESCGSSTERHPLSRNPSSGLTPSLVDQYGPSRSASSASRLDTFSKDMSNSSNNHKILPLGNNEDRTTFTLTSTQSSSPKSHLTQFNPRKESPLRVSMSALQETSGNKSSLDDVTTVRPSSDPATQPFIWDEKAEMKPGKPSALKDRDQGHKRQSRQRISFTASRPSSIAFEPMVEELDDDENTLSHAPILPGLFLTSPQQETLSPRPPSILTFEPWLKPPSTPGRGRHRDLGDYSKVVSVYESYNMVQGASSEDLASTPTRKPSSEKPYNRRSSIVSGTPSHPLWLLREPFIQKVSQPEFVDSPQIPFVNNKTLSSNVSQAPEKRPALENYITKERPEKGTRVAATRRSPVQRSPMRSAGRSPTRPLALAVMNQLRKKNSEVFDSDATYYMNILPGTPEMNDSEGLHMITPKRSFPKVHRTGDSGAKPIDRVWGDINREKEVVGLGITADFGRSDRVTTPETIYKQVNHFTGGT